MAIPELEVDGRRLRRANNREAVLDAMASLFAEGSYQPSSAEVAERAGLSPRSLFRYFADIDDLQRAAIARQLATARPLLHTGVDPGAPTAAKIERFVAARVKLYETVAPAARAARAFAPRHPLVARQLRESRAYLRNQLRRLFAAELRGDRAPLVAVVDALCSFDTYDLMRADQGLSRARATASLTAALTALLDP